MNVRKLMVAAGAVAIVAGWSVGAFADGQISKNESESFVYAHGSIDWKGNPDAVLIAGGEEQVVHEQQRRRGLWRLQRGRPRLGQHQLQLWLWRPGGRHRRPYTASRARAARAATTRAITPRRRPAAASAAVLPSELNHVTYDGRG